MDASGKVDKRFADRFRKTDMFPPASELPPVGSAEADLLLSQWLLIHEIQAARIPPDVLQWADSIVRLRVDKIQSRWTDREWRERQDAAGQVNRRSVSGKPEFWTVPVVEGHLERRDHSGAHDDRN
ncbi:hypothetical protein [Lignipirellula cremea]|uniref:Uncharacterized protein n=1 Tax=Lignipirellula cremea TaxID=2528010 RepID=A0A518DRQ4_9BACT|nr:hypothetical protein [Lignipirellula cremea]QDU94516.1 hypothetical protein Pla8534_23070 [Lignipirellula cremea]